MNIIRSFNEIPYHAFLDTIKQKIKEEIYGKNKDYILNVDESEYIEYLNNYFILHPLKIIDKTEIINEPKIVQEKREDPFYRRQYIVDTYEFLAKYQFEGSPILFRVQPNPWSMTSYDIYVDSKAMIVSFKFKITEKDVEKFNREKSDAYHCSFKNIENINKNVVQFNTEINSTIKSFFLRRKEELKKENDFFAAINIKVNEDTKSIFTVPTLKKKEIPQPKVTTHKIFSAEPIMSQAMYDDVLKVIYDFGKSMERKPSLYQGKDEEQLRDSFVMLLETRYSATTATGETFNKKGKTDIILKFADDGTNLFVAECKFWHGSTEFIKAISQLFDRYLTWRDSKTALILFSTNKDFTSVLNTIKTDIKKHPYYVADKNTRRESSFSYTFHLAEDKNKEVMLEVIVFNFA